MSQETSPERREASQKLSPERREKLTDAFSEKDIVCRTHVGGQALIEGIMMRGRYNWAVAVRQPNGSIYLEEHELASGKDKNSWMYKPVVRGCTAMVESLALGYKALEIAAEHAYADEDYADRGEAGGGEAGESALIADSALAADPARTAHPALAAEQDNCAQQGDTAEQDNRTEQGDTAEQGGLAKDIAEDDAQDATKDAAEDAAKGVANNSAKQVAKGAANNFPKDTKATTAEAAETEDSGLPKGVLGVSMVIGVLLGVAIFIVAPALITNWLVGDYGEKTLLWNLVDGVLRVAIFVGYLFLIGRLPDIKRMFGYHGAEHRTIHCYERGCELTVDNAQSYPSLHVRCGTAFMLMTMIIAILVFTLVPINALIDGLGIENDILRLLLVIVSRIVLLPLIAGLSYEFTVKWAGSRPDNPVVKVVLWPGLQMQRLTTNPPDDGMVECAIAAMNAVLAREQQATEQHEPAQATGSNG